MLGPSGLHTMLLSKSNENNKSAGGAVAFILALLAALPIRFMILLLDSSIVLSRVTHRGKDVCFLSESDMNLLGACLPSFLCSTRLGSARLGEVDNQWR